MRKQPTKRIEQYRVTTGEMGSDRSMGGNGAFLIPYSPRWSNSLLNVIASDGTEWREAGLELPAWEHVSVSLKARCPTWEEMDYVKRIFWRDDETVLQFHVPRDQHISHHDFCLHMWKPIGVEIPLPPAKTVA